VSFGFRAHTSCTLLLYEFTETGPGIITADEVNCFILTRVSGKYVVMFVAENTEPRLLESGTYVMLS
jgi:hypothetical protein